MDVSENFALRFTGALVPPPGAAQVIVDVGADDVGVVFFDGEPVASADEEFATSVFRTDRVPATSEPIDVFGPVEIEIVLANGVGAYAWDVRLRFLAADGTVLAENAPPSAFVLP
jgi:hypothetical protein